MTAHPDHGASQPPPVSPVELDAEALARLHALDPDGRQGVVSRVLGVFETSLARMLEQLNAECDDGEDGDAGVVMVVAHTLRSSSAAVGAMRLAMACADVERRLRSATPGELHADVQRLVGEGEAALVAVRAMLRE